jgi:hypothetical protein
LSTKATIDHGDGFHLYADVFEPDHVFLELTGEGFNFRASRDYAVIAIPYDLWERLRKADVAGSRPDPIGDDGVAPLPRPARPDV